MRKRDAEDQAMLLIQIGLEGVPRRKQLIDARELEQVVLAFRIFLQFLDDRPGVVFGQLIRVLHALHDC